MTYTHIPVMYRDGANYKSYGTIVLEGCITPEQVAELKGYCREISLDYDVVQFKPQVLGMEHHAYGEGGWNDNYDHPWHDMFLDEIEFVDGRECFGNYVERPGTVAEFIAAVKVAHDIDWETTE